MTGERDAPPDFLPAVSCRDVCKVSALFPKCSDLATSRGSPSPPFFLKFHWSEIAGSGNGFVWEREIGFSILSSLVVPGELPPFSQLEGGVVAVPISSAFCEEQVRNRS